jgi:hypothetical protein
MLSPAQSATLRDMRDVWDARRRTRARARAAERPPDQVCQELADVFEMEVLPLVVGNRPDSYCPPCHRMREPGCRRRRGARAINAGGQSQLTMQFWKVGKWASQP